MVLEGFYPILPIWLIITIFVIVLYLTVWSFRRFKKAMPKWKYWLWITLRCLIWIVICIVLLQPRISQYNDYVIKPTLAIYWDNSKSIKINKGNYNGGDIVNRLKSNFTEAWLNDFDPNFYRFDAEVEPTLITEPLSLIGNETHFENVFDHLKDREYQTDAAIIISDGIFNRGKDVQFITQNISIPIYTLALGDTSRLKDVVIENVNVIPRAYVQQLHNVDIELYAKEMQGETLTLQLRRSDTIIVSQNIKITEPNQYIFHQLQFAPKRHGTFQYTLEILPIEGEWNIPNNSYSFFLDVLKSRLNVMYIAFEIHPDIRFIQRLLQNDPNIQLNPYVWIGDNRFANDKSWNANLKPDIIILHGFPSNLPITIADNLKNYITQTPTLFFATENTDWQYIEKEYPLLVINTFNDKSKKTWQKKNLAINTNIQHPILEKNTLPNGILPTIYSLDISPQDNISTLNLIQSNNQEKATPIISVQETALRRGVVYATDWFHFFQHPNNEIRSFVEKLFFDTITWLGTQKASENITLKIPTTNLNESSPINVSAYIYNDLGQYVPDAIITLTVRDSENKTIATNIMKHQKGAEYHATFKNLTKGRYTLNARASHSDFNLDATSMRFEIGENSLELRNTVRNDIFLRTIAENTNGAFYTYPQSQNLFIDIAQNKNFETLYEKKLDRYALQHSYSWFIILILLITVDWIMRKYFSYE